MCPVMAFTKHDGAHFSMIFMPLGCITSSVYQIPCLSLRPNVDCLSSPPYHSTCHRDHGILGTLNLERPIGGTSCPLVPSSRVVVSVASVPNPFAHKGVPNDTPTTIQGRKFPSPPYSSPLAFSTQK